MCIPFDVRVNHHRTIRISHSRSHRLVGQGFLNRTLEYSHHGKRYILYRFLSSWVYWDFGIVESGCAIPSCVPCGSRMAEWGFWYKYLPLTTSFRDGPGHSPIFFVSIVFPQGETRCSVVFRVVNDSEEDELWPLRRLLVWNHRQHASNSMAPTGELKVYYVKPNHVNDGSCHDWTVTRPPSNT